MLEVKPMPLLPFMTEDTLDLCANLQLREHDIFICSYPKSGTTWTQHIIISILLQNRLNLNKCEIGDSQSSIVQEVIPYTHVSQFAPFYEVEKHWDKPSKNLNSEIQLNQSWLGWRVFNTHLRWDMLPKSSKIYSGDLKSCRRPKFIYITRSPLDACVSFFHHLSNQNEGGFVGTFDDFFTKWTKGEIAFGSYSDHILSFSNAFEVGEEDIFLLSYEEMVSNLPHAVDKLIDFLELDNSITLEQREKLLPTFKFSSMAKKLDKFQPKSVTWKNDFQFLRKGRTGDAKHMMSQKQIDLYRELIKEDRVLEKINSCEIDNKEKNIFLSLFE